MRRQCVLLLLLLLLLLLRSALRRGGRAVRAAPAGRVTAGGGITSGRLHASTGPSALAEHLRLHLRLHLGLHLGLHLRLHLGLHLRLHLARDATDEVRLGGSEQRVLEGGACQHAARLRRRARLLSVRVKGEGWSWGARLLSVRVKGEW